MLQFQVYDFTAQGKTKHFCAVELTPAQIGQFSLAFDFAKTVLNFIECQSLKHPAIVIEDDNNWIAVIYPDSKTLKGCLTIGARWPSEAAVTSQLKRILGDKP